MPLGLMGICSNGFSSSSSSSSSSSLGRSYFSILRRRKGLNGGAKRGLRTGWVGKGDNDEEVVSDSSVILGIVSSKSNSSSSHKYTE
jgi:hypothetical protein